MIFLESAPKLKENDRTGNRRLWPCLGLRGKGTDEKEPDGGQAQQTTAETVRQRIEARGERVLRLASSDEETNELRDADPAIRRTRRRLGLRKAEVMNATLLYRIASGLLVVFAASHTSGMLTFEESAPEVRSVQEAMDSVHFPLMGSTCSYGGFYMGFGLLLTAYLLFSAFLAWHLGGLARRNPQAIGALAWGLFTVQVVNLALSWMYFFLAPVAMSALVGICLGWAAWLVTGAKAGA